MIRFQVNKYPGYPKPVWTVRTPDDLTDQGEADSVRTILDRFARQSITPEQPSRAAYADTFTDDEDLTGDRIVNLLDHPDLSNLSEVEMQEYIDANTEMKRVSDFDKSPSSNPEKVAEDPEPTPPSSDSQPAE